MNMRSDYDTQRAGRKVFLEGGDGEYRVMGDARARMGAGCSVELSGLLARQERAAHFPAFGVTGFFAGRGRIPRGKSIPIGG